MTAGWLISRWARLGRWDRAVMRLACSQACRAASWRLRQVTEVGEAGATVSVRLCRAAHLMERPGCREETIRQG